ncbi:MAG: hypothetical protein ACREO1_08000 [Arenimonas sp.]
MSFDLYLQRFRNGEAAGIPMEVIRDAFGSQVVEMDEDFWQVQYGSDESSDIFMQVLPSDASLIHTISIHRPCRDVRLWQSLWLLLELPGTVFYFPGCQRPLSRDSQIGTAMPGDMRESLGEPVIASSAQEIFQSIDNI